MAVMPQVQWLIDQSRPTIVPKPSSTQGMALPPQRMAHQLGAQGVEVKRVPVRIALPRKRLRRILLGTINNPEFHVIKPIPVNLDVRETTVIASWREADEFGTGKSMSVACDDLGHTLAELYLSLKADEPRLGPDLARVWGVLKEHIAHVPRRP